MQRDFLNSYPARIWKEFCIKEFWQSTREFLSRLEKVFSFVKKVSLFFISEWKCKDASLIFVPFESKLKDRFNDDPPSSDFWFSIWKGRKLWFGTVITGKMTRLITLRLGGVIEDDRNCHGWNFISFIFVQSFLQASTFPKFVNRFG